MSESKETADWHDEFEETARRMFRLVSQRETVWLETKRENAALREALKQSRQFARDVGYSSRMFAAQIGITAAQLSKWTDSAPATEPDFKD